MGLPAKLKNFATFIDGISYVGEVEEVTLPKLKRKTEDWRGGGMPGAVKTDMGIDALEMEFTAGGFLRDVLMRMDRHTNKKSPRLGALGLWHDL